MSINNIAHIGQTIQTARRAQGLTQATVCEAVGVSRKTLSSLETGRIAEVGLRKVLAICALLGLELSVGAVAARFPTLTELRQAQLLARQGSAA
jgi:transcriptional regulator with XRE-family HTH domain